MSSNPIPCSVLVLTRNSLPGVERCLESLQEFAEVLVADGGSTDGTRETAGRFSNARVVDQDPRFLDPDGRITNFSGVRNAALAQSQFPWVLLVDSDEEIEPALCEEVRTIVRVDESAVYRAFRRFYVDGKRIDRCAGYPVYQIRLFHRGCTDGFVKTVHERLALRPGVEPRILRAEIRTPLPPADRLWPKYRRYLAIERARSAHRGWAAWGRWILYRNLRTMAAILVRSAQLRLLPGEGHLMPFRYEWLAVRYAWTLIWLTVPIRRNVRHG